MIFSNGWTPFHRAAFCKVIDVQTFYYWEQKNRHTRMVGREGLTTDSWLVVDNEKSRTFEEWREIIREQGELEFEESIAKYPIRVDLNLPEKMAERLARIERIETWLKESWDDDRYISFPTNAIGKYKEECRYVFVKNKDDAVLLKLGAPL